MSTGAAGKLCLCSVAHKHYLFSKSVFCYISKVNCLLILAHQVLESYSPYVESQDLGRQSIWRSAREPAPQHHLPRAGQPQVHHFTFLRLWFPGLQNGCDRITFLIMRLFSGLKEQWLVDKWMCQLLPSAANVGPEHRHPRR